MGKSYSHLNKAGTQAASFILLNMTKLLPQLKINESSSSRVREPLLRLLNQN